MWSALCLLCAVAALLSKENAATLPLAVVLIECTLFRRGARAMLGPAVAGAAGMILLWLLVATIFGRHPFSLQAMRPLTSGPFPNSRPAYPPTPLPRLWA